jgi:hypothetical protein
MMADQTPEPEDSAAELHARWARKGAPLVETIPAEAIDNRVRDAVATGVDAWLRSVVAARGGDHEPGDD